MLSKLFYHDHVMPISEKFIDTINFYISELTGGGAELLNNAGTLGICFRVEFDKGIFFLKTHYPEDNLLKMMEHQIKLLDIVYGEELSVQQFYLTVDKNRFCFLLMDWLEPVKALPSTTQIKDIISYYNSKFEKNDAVNSLYKNMYSFKEILTEGNKAIIGLYEAGLIEYEIKNKCLNCIKILEQYYSNKKSEVICHGDLSNKNIMHKNGKLYLIDWEDAFLGIENYDICYWLTFFDQRALYSEHLFDKLGVDKTIGVSLMAIIVVLKCYISYLRKNHAKNTLSFDQRLEEIFFMIRNNI